MALEKQQATLLKILLTFSYISYPSVFEKKRKLNQIFKFPIFRLNAKCTILRKMLYGYVICVKIKKIKIFNIIYEY